ncbi:GNAT family N-acetyltransferase [Nocardioides nanhaiensis]|uniref:N-acetyltransferase domain-containing protein n=1 Tax=Nocardioides nanhaiensis TaxID=1476871 RepID=A0ABP8WFI5_9ACTN
MSDAVPALPPLISTARLRLIPISATDAADMTAGRHQERWHADYPRPDDVAVAALVRADAEPAAASWGPRHVVLGVHAVGMIGCFAPPVDGEADVAVGLVEAVRGQGVAAEALAALTAAAEQVGVRLRAATEPGDAAGLRLLAGCGYTRLRGATEDGQLVMVRP